MRDRVRATFVFLLQYGKMRAIFPVADNQRFVIKPQPFSSSEQPLPTGVTAPLLQASSLSCIRQDRVLFDTLNLQLCSGDLLQIAGKNGAGKSSLLRLLAGLALPEDGQIHYLQQPLAQVSAVYAANLCYIGHHSGIHEQLTALENIAFWRAASGIARTATALTDEYNLLARLGLIGLEEIPCRMLSAGQQRRVSLARLWFCQRQIWILDEPFTALDQGAITQLQQHFLQHLHAGGAIVLTTHQPLSLHYEKLRSMELSYRW